MIRRVAPFTLLLLACHSDPFGPAERETPTPRPADSLGVPVTFNPHGDTDPEWSGDGRHLQYTWSDAKGHRCAGLLPVAAPRRIWALCDDRAHRGDSISAFSAVAIREDGALLYQQTIARMVQYTGSITTGPLQPGPRTLWLADTAAPFDRRPLLTLPTGIGAGYVETLRRATWTGPATFVASGALYRFLLIGPPNSAIYDTLYLPVGLFRGTIGPTGATLAAIPGTSGVSAYALTPDRSALIYPAGALSLMRLPLAGGAATLLATLPPHPAADGAIVALDCAATWCAVTSTGAAGWALRRVDLTTGATQMIREGSGGLPPGGYRVSPVTGDAAYTVVHGVVHFYCTLERIHLLPGALTAVP